MNPNIRPSSDLKYLGQIVPQSVASGQTKTSAYVAVDGLSYWIAAQYNVGTVDSGQVTIQLYQATASDGTGAKVLGSPVALTTNNHMGFVQAHIDDLDIGHGFKYVAVHIDTDANVASGALISAALLTAGQRYETGPTVST